MIVTIKQTLRPGVYLIEEEYSQKTLSVYGDQTWRRGDSVVVVDRAIIGKAGKPTGNLPTVYAV